MKKTLKCASELSMMVPISNSSTQEAKAGLGVQGQVLPAKPCFKQQKKHPTTRSSSGKAYLSCRIWRSMRREAKYKCKFDFQVCFSPW